MLIKISDDFDDLFDEISLGETLLPKLPIILDAGKQLISSHSLLFTLEIVIILFNV